MGQVSDFNQPGPAEARRIRGRTLGPQYASSTLEAARAHFPDSNPRTEREAIYNDLVAATVILRRIAAQMPYDEDDVEFHDIRQIASAVRRAQEFMRD